MKLYSKLSALGAVLVITTAFASADTIILSNSGSTSYGGRITSVTSPPALPVPLPTAPFVGGGATFDISPGTTWASAIGASSWISGSSTWAPGGGTNATYGYYLYTYDTPLDNGILNLSVYADDTVTVYVDNVAIITAADLTLDNSYCATSAPSCHGTLHADISNYAVNAGQVLSFVVTQAGTATGNPTGLDFAGSNIGGLSVEPVPEPSSLLMLGTGLIGSAGMMMRRMRVVRK